MSTKQIVQDLLERLPEDVSLREVARELEFVAGVREGLESFKNEGGISLEDAKSKITAWAKAASQ